MFMFSTALTCSCLFLSMFFINCYIPGARYNDIMLISLLIIFRKQCHTEISHWEEVCLLLLGEKKPCVISDNMNVFNQICVDRTSK